MKKGFSGKHLAIFLGAQFAVKYDLKNIFDTVGTVPGEETAIFFDAYRRANVWGVFPLIGEPYEKRLTASPIHHA